VEGPRDLKVKACSQGYKLEARGELYYIQLIELQKLYIEEELLGR
jgi:hypothetical protein